jgi:RNA polymerase sigma-70 factor, ECF subfamily
MSPELQHIVTGCKKLRPREQEALYRYCYEPMMAVCIRYARDHDEATDMYNQAMLKVFGNIAQFEEKGVFMGWIRRIMVNTCIDVCRRRVKYAIRPVDDEEETQFFIAPEAESRISSAETLVLMKQLPDKTGLVFNLFAIEGYSHPEIAEKLGISTGTSKWHVNEARRLLQSKIQLILNKEMNSHAS